MSCRCVTEHPFHAAHAPTHTTPAGVRADSCRVGEQSADEHSGAKRKRGGHGSMCRWLVRWLGSIGSRVPRTKSARARSRQFVRCSALDREYEEWLLNREVPHDKQSSYTMTPVLVLHEGAARSHVAWSTSATTAEQRRCGNRQPRAAQQVPSVLATGGVRTRQPSFWERYASLVAVGRLESSRSREFSRILDTACGRATRLE